MSIHIAAKEHEIASTVLMPGDPLRAKFIAETMLEDAVCYSEVRGMYGYTGYYNGKRISVQGSGMGVPSISIYANELINSYGVENIIRIGTCGSMQPDLHVRDIVLAMTSCTDSSINRLRFNGMDYAPTADFGLLNKAFHSAAEKGITPKVGSILTADSFYNDNPEHWKLWASYGVLAIEMETSALYTIAAKHGVKALTILTVSDSLITSELTSAEERQKTFNSMVEIALEIA